MTLVMSGSRAHRIIPVFHAVEHHPTLAGKHFKQKRRELLRHYVMGGHHDVA